MGAYNSKPVAYLVKELGFTWGVHSLICEIGLIALDQYLLFEKKNRNVNERELDLPRQVVSCNVRVTQNPRSQFQIYIHGIYIEPKEKEAKKQVEYNKKWSLALLFISRQAYIGSYACSNIQIWF